MSTALSVVLLLLSFFWLDPAAAQRASRDSPPWSLSVREGQLSASIDRIPLRRVLEELARQTPLHLSVSEKWRDHPVTAHFRALPLGKALAQLLAGLSYALIYTPAPHGVGSPATHPMVDLMVFDAAPATQDSPSREADLASNTGTEPLQGLDQGQDQAAALLDTPPEWTAALQNPDKEVRRAALQQWAGQGAATPLDPLTYALVDPDESVRAKAQELVEQVWLAKAGAR